MYSKLALKSLLLKIAIFQKVRFISDVTQDHGEKIFKWHTVAVNITSGLGCYLKDNTLTRKIEIVQAVCE